MTRLPVGHVRRRAADETNCLTAVALDPIDDANAIDMTMVNQPGDTFHALGAIGANRRATGPGLEHQNTAHRHFGRMADGYRWPRSPVQTLNAMNSV